MNAKELKAMIQSGMTSSQRLLNSGMNVNALRTCTTLRKDEWKAMDEAVVKHAQQRLRGVGRLMSLGLTYSVANGLGKTILESENVSDMNDAEINMDGVTRNENDVIEYDLVGVPLPIISKAFQINIRKLNSSRDTGESIDTTQAELSALKVADKQETILFQGASAYTFGGYTIRGYVDDPNRNTGFPGEQLGRQCSYGDWHEG